MQTGRRASNRTRQGKSWFWSGHQIFLFLVLISVFVLVRIFSIYGIVSPLVCDHIEQTALGSEHSLLDGPMDMVFWTGVAGAALVIAFGIHGLVTQARFSRAALALGIINFAAALGLMVYAALYWAYFYPDKPGAAFVNRWSASLVEVNPVSLAEPADREWLPEVWMTSEFGWTRQSQFVFTHDSGIRAEHRRVNSCLAADFRDRHLVLRGFERRWVAQGKALANTGSFWVLYDADGRMILWPDGYYSLVDPAFFAELEVARRDPSPMEAKAVFVGFWQAYYNTQSDNQRWDPLLTVDDYELMVREELLDQRND